jgi:hypothetical protein
MVPPLVDTQTNLAEITITLKKTLKLVDCLRSLMLLETSLVSSLHKLVVLVTQMSKYQA